jgi:hypothetical protein
LNRLLAAAGIGALIFTVLEGPSSAQQAEKGGKAAAAKPEPAKKPGTTTQPAAPAAPKKAWSPSELAGATTPYAEITRGRSGKPLLVIHYPWREYTRPSVEVRWMDDNEADNAELRPLQFVADVMRGEITSAVYAAREAAWGAPTSKTLKDHGREFQILGEKNLLKQPAATVLFPARPTGDDRGARAIFFPLEPWGVDRQTLWLDLPSAQFAEPGRIRVWFYRGGTVLWWKTLIWPGMEGKN